MITHWGGPRAVKSPQVANTKKITLQRGSPWFAKEDVKCIGISFVVTAEILCERVVHFNKLKPISDETRVLCHFSLCHPLCYICHIVEEGAHKTEREGTHFCLTNEVEPASPSLSLFDWALLIPLDTIVNVSLDVSAHVRERERK